MTHQEDAIRTLEDLIRTCRDGQEGYRDAAQHIKDPSIKTWLNEQSLLRAEFVGELESLAQVLGKPDPVREGSVGGTLRRKWFELKEKLGGDDESVLAEVERGEDSAQKDYDDALKRNLSADVRAVITRQAASIVNAHDHARSLRDQHKLAA